MDNEDNNLSILNPYIFIICSPVPHRTAASKSEHSLAGWPRSLLHNEKLLPPVTARQEAHRPREEGEHGRKGVLDRSENAVLSPCGVWKKRSRGTRANGQG